jgi:hypothetical protein
LLSEILGFGLIFRHSAEKGGKMTKEERRLKEFASGLANLGEYSRDYLHNLTKALFFIEKPPVSPIGGTEKPGPGTVAGGRVLNQTLE